MGRSWWGLVVVALCDVGCVGASEEEPGAPSSLPAPAEVTPDATFPVPPPPGAATLVNQVASSSRAWSTDASVQDCVSHYEAYHRAAGRAPITVPGGPGMSSVVGEGSSVTILRVGSATNVVATLVSP